MTTDISFVADMAELAEASYANFDSLESDDVVNTLKAGDMKFSTEQAEAFVVNWSVVDQMPNTDSGFSATLFHSTTDGYVFAIRGTDQRGQSNLIFNT